jgi:hypothetical protein
VGAFPDGVRRADVRPVGFFHKFAGKDYEDKRPRDRYVGESKRLLGVMDQHLDGRQWFMDDDYTIADISMLGWVRNLIGFYGARELVAFDTFRNVGAWLQRGLARPAVQRGLNIPKRRENSLLRSCPRKRGIQVLARGGPPLSRGTDAGSIHGRLRLIASMRAVSPRCR